MTPPGWKLVTTNGTQRAINPEGVNVSYGQYLNAQARMSGFKSHSDYRKQAKAIAAFRTPAGKKLLQLGSKDLGTLREQILAGKPPDTSPDGPFARLLVKLGMREASATYAVGDTP